MTYIPEELCFGDPYTQMVETAREPTKVENVQSGDLNHKS